MTPLVFALSIALTASPEPVDRYVEQILAAQREGDLSRAAQLGDACVERHQTAAVCYRVAALVYLNLSQASQNSAAREKVRTYLTRYLELAPKSDRFVVKAKAILEHAK